MTDFTWLDIVHKHLPNISLVDADHILWEYTAFPLASPTLVEQQIKDMVNETPIYFEVYQDLNFSNYYNEYMTVEGML